MALAERDSAWPLGPLDRGGAFRADSGLPDWASALLVAAIFAVLVAGLAFVARRLGLRPKLSWFFAVGVGLWLFAPVAADHAAGSVLAATGLLLIPGALAAEFLLRRRDDRVHSVG
jgi:hypothetical protein